MDDVKLIDFETTQPIIAEMRRQLPRIAKMLTDAGTKVVNPSDLAIIDYDYLSREYMHSDHRDNVIKTDGVLNDMPHIQRKRLHKAGPVGIGIYIYQNRLDTNIKYAVYIVKGPHWDESYLIVAKRDLFRLRRNMIRQNRLSGEVTHPPILPDGVLEEVVQKTIGFLLKARQIERYGVKIKRGIILDGSPGNGKTMLCRYIQKLCSQNNIRWGVVSSADIDSAYEDKELGDLFSRYTVTFFDDIDVAYMDRGKGNGKMACSLLTAMDGMSEEGHLVRIFTTNEPVGELDGAFTRPGRIDEQFTLGPPNDALRRRLVDQVWPEEIRSNIDVNDLILSSIDFSFAEMEAIRTLLVTNKILGDGKWDLKKAFAEFEARRAEGKRKKKKKVGFSDK